LTSVSQKVKSGKDYRYKGAKKIELEGGEGRARRDVVTYPGGDRVDWKEFEIPEGAPGILRVKLKFRPPRPGLDVAFNVYDAYFERIAQAKPSKNGKRTKSVKIENARPGKYYVQVYAPGRGDAGTYMLSVRWKERPPVVAGGPEPVGDIPDPPTLPAVPEAEPEVAGPTPDVPPTPTPQPCPNDPTKTQPDCEEVVEAKPITGRVVNYKVSAAGGIILYIDRGKRAGIGKGWKGQVLDSSGSPVAGGSFTVTQVSAIESRGKVKLSVDQVKANRRVLLSPQG
jgi:hypothetical protein